VTKSCEEETDNKNQVFFSLWICHLFGASQGCPCGKEEGGAVAAVPRTGEWMANLNSASDAIRRELRNRILGETRQVEKVKSCGMLKRLFFLRTDFAGWKILVS
jgi:hypothetical protein